MQAFIRRAGGLAAAFVLLAGCGTDTQTSAVASSTARGTLVENPPLRIASLSAAALAAELTASGTSGQQLLQIAGTPACGVDFHYFHYQTVDPAGMPIRDSGALMIPTGGTGCTGARPIVLYAHGTDTNKALNIADITDPGNSEGALVATMFAAQGYIVVAPNYAGYDDSTLGYHPYLNADQQSKDMIDALAAARSALGKVIAAGTTDNGKLFITGYSQGGFVAMATHKALQADGKVVTASGPMSGPYALEAFGDAIMYGSVDLGSTVFTPLLTTSFQKSYGNIYMAASDVYESAYATSIEGLLPSTTSLTDLFTTGKLPQLQLFHDTDWTGLLGNAQLEAALNVPAVNPQVPVTALFAAGFGPNNLVKDSYRLGYILDAVANPDGTVPAATTLQAAAAPAHPLRQAFKANDLRNWTPTTAPVFLCGGSQDPTVFYAPNTGGMQAYWTYVAPPAAPQLLTVLDLESAITGPADPFALAKGGFAQAKALTATAAGGGAAGAQAVTQAYHGGLVPPFCTAAVRGFFSQF
jgi:poly(3-hydroxybutyrate) depolymerase